MDEDKIAAIQSLCDKVMYLTFCDNGVQFNISMIR